MVGMASNDMQLKILDRLGAVRWHPDRQKDKETSCSNLNPDVTRPSSSKGNQRISSLNRSRIFEQALSRKSGSHVQIGTNQEDVFSIGEELHSEERLDIYGDHHYSNTLYPQISVHKSNAAKYDNRLMQERLREFRNQRSKLNQNQNHFKAMTEE